MSRVRTFRCATSAVWSPHFKLGCMTISFSRAICHNIWKTIISARSVAMTTVPDVAGLITVPGSAAPKVPCLFISDCVMTDSRPTATLHSVAFPRHCLAQRYTYPAVFVSMQTFWRLHSFQNSYPCTKSPESAKLLI